MELSLYGVMRTPSLVIGGLKTTSKNKVEAQLLKLFLMVNWDGYP